MSNLGNQFGSDDWGVILGGSSGFGLATAHKLAAHGMNLCVIHRDRRGAMKRIEPEFEKIRGTGVELITHNADALSAEKRDELTQTLAQAMGEGGRVRMLLHSIAFGNLKLLVPEKKPEQSGAARLAAAIGVDEEKLREAADQLFEEGVDEMAEIASAPVYSDRWYLDAEDFARTIYSMGTSMIDWVQVLHERSLFAEDARVFGLTSEGNAVAWKGYAAVAAAKVALESVARSVAVEYAPYGVRCNVLQPGVTHTPAQAAIPGDVHMRAHARLRNPYRRLTTPQDVANVVYLMCQPEAAWINGEVIRIDGGEHISGGTA
ncbi:MAG: SDR family oxidoreductase [bacterium]|nr:SDR family oxidoreductase [bacterium]